MKLHSAVAPLVSTLMACTTVLLAFLLTVFVVTGQFDHWTFEEKRRYDAALRRLVAPTIQVRTAQGTLRTLWPKPIVDHRVTLVNFIYTSCPTVCQTLGSEFQQIQNILASQTALQRNPIDLLSISFDIEHDGIVQLTAFAQRYDADEYRWTIAVPFTRVDTEALLQALKIVVIPDEIGGYVHNGNIHLIDASGVVLAIYDDADWKLALATALRISQKTR